MSAATPAAPHRKDNPLDNANNQDQKPHQQREQNQKEQQQNQDRPEKQKDNVEKNPGSQNTGQARVESPNPIGA